MTNALPPALRAAISEMTQDLPQSGISERSTRISQTYRAGGTSAEAIRSTLDVAAYLTARLPATYAAITHVLEEMAARWEDFSPVSIADIGCGPGTGLLAALDLWPEIEDIFGYDANRAFLKAAEKLLRQTHLAQDRTLALDAANFRRDTNDFPATDLTILSYALVEIPAPEVALLATKLFARTHKALVLVEPGSPAGFAAILSARQALLAQGATLLAPCPHHNACPIEAPDWCHFNVRLARSRDHLRAKQAAVPFEDEKFSYLVAVKDAVFTPAEQRILKPVHLDKTGLSLTTCSEKGREEQHLNRRDPRFAALRRLDWGDSF